MKTAHFFSHHLAEHLEVARAREHDGALEEEQHA
jgi:hypothetical protein